MFSKFSLNSHLQKHHDQIDLASSDANRFVFTKTSNSNPENPAVSSSSVYPSTISAEDFNEDDLSTNVGCEKNDEEVEDEDENDGSDLDDDHSISSTTRVSSLSGRSTLSKKKSDSDIQFGYCDVKLSDLISFNCKSHRCHLGGECTRRVTIGEVDFAQKSFFSGGKICSAERRKRIFNLLLNAKRYQKGPNNSKSGVVFEFPLDNPYETRSYKTHICLG